jgi:hypothetical protein
VLVDEAKVRAARLMRRFALRLTDRALLCGWNRWTEIAAQARHAAEAEARARGHAAALEAALQASAAEHALQAEQRELEHESKLAVELAAKESDYAASLTLAAQVGQDQYEVALAAKEEQYTSALEATMRVQELEHTLKVQEREQEHAYQMLAELARSEQDLREKARAEALREEEQRLAVESSEARNRAARTMHRCIGRLASAAKVSAWGRWVLVDEAKVRAARLMRRFALRLTDRALLCGWNRWTEIAAQAIMGETVLRKWAFRVVMVTLNKSFGKWRDLMLRAFALRAAKKMLEVEYTTKVEKAAMLVQKLAAALRKLYTAKANKCPVCSMPVGRTIVPVPAPPAPPPLSPLPLPPPAPPTPPAPSVAWLVTMKLIREKLGREHREDRFKNVAKSIAKSLKLKDIQGQNIREKVAFYERSPESISSSVSSVVSASAIAGDSSQSNLPWASQCGAEASFETEPTAKPRRHLFDGVDRDSDGQVDKRELTLAVVDCTVKAAPVPTMADLWKVAALRISSVTKKTDQALQRQECCSSWGMQLHKVLDESPPAEVSSSTNARDANAAAFALLRHHLKGAA